MSKNKGNGNPRIVTNLTPITPDAVPTLFIALATVLTNRTNPYQDGKRFCRLAHKHGIMATDDTLIGWYRKVLQAADVI